MKKKTSLGMVPLFLSFALACSACSQARTGEDERERSNIQQGVKKFIGDELRGWLQASRELAEHAPLPADRGWDAALDKDAIQSMKKDWEKARWAYERIEGAIAPMFPESDTATDARYDDFLGVLGSVGDPNPFDDKGVVGAHALERIVWADSTPEEVITFEKGLPGYRPARFPANAAEAKSFKQELAQRFVLDIQKLDAEFQPLTLDLAFAFRGLIDLAAEQVEKVDRAATGRATPSRRCAIFARTAKGVSPPTGFSGRGCSASPKAPRSIAPSPRPSHGSRRLTLGSRETRFRDRRRRGRASKRPLPTKQRRSASSTRS